MNRRGVKRTGRLTATTTTTTISPKRRAPYALRACTACRRRKGKCDGRLPCSYCEDRTRACISDGEYAPVPHAGYDVTTTTAGTGTRQHRPDPAEEAYSRAGAPSDHNAAAVTDPVLPSDPSSLHDVVASLRAQLLNVESVLASYSQNEHVHEHDAPLATAPRPPVPAGDTEAEQQHPHGGFCGPTSPEYSMNVVRMTLRHRGYLAAPASHEPGLPSFDSDHELSEARPWRSPCRDENQHRLRQFRSRLTLADAKKALSIYGEVVGELHAFVDMGSMQDQLAAWYDSPPGSPVENTQQAEYNHLIIFNLILAIASRSRTEDSYTVPADTMRAVLQCAVDASITSSTPTMKHVTIALLLGHYYIFEERAQLALRMFGSAGRILMELGLHSGDVVEQTLATEAQRKEAHTLMCSVVVLDRQWNAMAGLPANFAPHTFSLRPSYLADSPYATTMYRLVLMSDKFNDVISLAATRRLASVDDDTVEVMRFRVRQWQAKSVGATQTLDNLDTWLAHPSSRPPAWALLLLFRAASIESLLLRSYFFPGAGTIDRSRAHITPATELLARSINALAALDAAASVFDRHWPYYQHLLNSICALVFLLVGYVRDHRAALAGYVPSGFDGTMRCCLEDAGALAERYAGVSASARRLRMRIREVRRAAEKDAARPAEGLDLQELSLDGVCDADTTSLEHRVQPVSQGWTADGQEDVSPETDAFLFGADLGLDFSAELDNCLSQDFQAWDSSVWPSTWDSYLFR